MYQNTLQLGTKIRAKLMGKELLQCSEAKKVIPCSGQTDSVVMRRELA